MIPRFGTPPQASVKYQIRHGVYAILPRDGSLLLTVQYAEKPDVQLPGGGVDQGEHPLAALHREVMEETGWIIANPKRIGAFRRFVFMPEYDLWAEKLCTIYVAFPVARKCDPLETGHAPVWADPETAMKILGNEGDCHFVKQVLRPNPQYSRAQ